MKKLFIIRGLPGSGKTTLAHQLTDKVWEADMFFTLPDNTYHFEVEKLSDAHLWCQERIRDAMLLQYPVIVVSNTFVRRWEMEPYYEFATLHGYEVTEITMSGNSTRTSMESPTRRLNECETRGKNKVDIITTPKKNIIMDATMLSSLMGCGRYHDIRFNHRLVSIKGKSNSLEIGSLIHKVLEVYYKHMIKGFPRTTAIGNSLTAGQLFITGCPYCADGINPEPSCKHEPMEYPGVSNSPEVNEGFKVGWRFALDTCQQYFDFYKNDAFIPLAVEWVKGEIVYEDDEIRVLWKAKFDLTIDTNQIGIVSMDHKTFKQRRDKITLSNQFMGHCLLLKSRNVLVNKIGLQTTLKISERLTREMVSFSSDRLLEWQSEVLPYYAYKYIQYTESGYWPPNFTHCDNVFGPCSYKEVCESDRNMRVEVLRSNFQKAMVWDPTNKEEE